MRKAAAIMMVGLLLILSLATAATAADRKWTCSRYYNGSYEGYTTFWASSYEDAMNKAREFWKNVTYHTIKCE